MSTVTTPSGARSAPLPRRLDAILRDTSRSIYLTLSVVPRSMRPAVMLGYLFCRAADTIADTRALPREERRRMLSLYREQFESARPSPESLDRIRDLVASGGDAVSSGVATRDGFTASEGALLRNLDACFEVYGELIDEDRRALRTLLGTLTRGMEIDLESFPPEERASESGEVGVLETDADLDRYCYHVAGCVGEFWTDVQAAHAPALKRLDHDRMRELGVRFGKGLQLTNVLRDMPADLRIGRCYIPRPRLEHHGVEAGELLAAVTGDDTAGVDAIAGRIGPIVDDLLDLTLEHLRAGRDYLLSIPRRLVRLRLASAWPLLIGLRTVALLRGRKRQLLSGERLKISRREVRGLIIASALRAPSNRAMRRLCGRLEREAARDAGDTG